MTTVRSMVPISSATLRTKTGCLTCRTRRKKCNEERPQCGNCLKSGRVCSWPSENDLFDRRHSRTSRTSPAASKSPEVSVAQTTPSQLTVCRSSGATTSICREIAFGTDLFNSGMFKSDLELDCFHQFVEGFLPLLILPSTHSGFRASYIPEVVEMMVNFEGFKNVALACGAARMYTLTGSSQMDNAGITYYTQAVSQVNQALSSIDFTKETSDAVLMTVIFLYIHGVSPLFCFIY